MKSIPSLLFLSALVSGVVYAEKEFSSEESEKQLRSRHEEAVRNQQENLGDREARERQEALEQEEVRQKDPKHRINHKGDANG